MFVMLRELTKIPSKKVMWASEGGVRMAWSCCPYRIVMTIHNIHSGKNQGLSQTVDLQSVIERQKVTDSCYSIFIN